MSGMDKEVSNITIENAEIFGKNFKGEKKLPYNKEGNRNFCVFVDRDTATTLKNDGWNIKETQPREGDDPDDFETKYYLRVKVSYGGKVPPIAVLINSRGKKKLTEETIDQLDWVYIDKCDLIINPYVYEIPETGKRGISAYLKAIYVTVKEDYLESKYADVPDLDY